MKLTGIAWRGYSLPFRSKYVTAGSRDSFRCGLLLSVATSEGLVGVGEASPVGAGSVAEVKEIALSLEKIASRLVKKDADSLESSLPETGLPASLRLGIETALLDIKGQALGKPVSALLGGKPASLAVNCLIAAESARLAAEEASEAVRAGFTSLKLKVGGKSIADDEKLVSEVRRAAGPQVKLRLDPNQSWSVERAIESILLLSRYDIEYVEQPVAAPDISGLAKVRRSAPVPIAADESLGSMDDLRRLLDMDAADIFIIKAARLGGLKSSLAIASEAIKAGKSVTVTSSLESGVGIAASAHLAAVLPAQPYSHGLATSSLFTEDITSPVLEPLKGMLLTPDSPGLGVKVNAALLRKYGNGIIGSVGSLFPLP